RDTNFTNSHEFAWRSGALVADPLFKYLYMGTNFLFLFGLTGLKSARPCDFLYGGVEEKTHSRVLFKHAGLSRALLKLNRADESRCGKEKSSRRVGGSDWSVRRWFEQHVHEETQTTSNCRWVLDRLPTAAYAGS